MWAIPVKKKYSKTTTQDFSNILSAAKQSPLKIESNRGADFYNSIFEKFLETKNIQHYSQFTDKVPSIADRVIRTIRNLLKKRVFLAGNADCLSELSSIIKQYNNTIHNSTKIKPIDVSKKSNEKLVCSKFQDKRKILNPKYKLGQIVRTADIKRVFSKGDSTNYSYKLYTFTEVIHDTIPSYRINYLPERYNKNLLLPTKLSLDENNRVMKELNLIQKYNK